MSRRCLATSLKGLQLGAQFHSRRNATNHFDQCRYQSSPRILPYFTKSSTQLNGVTRLQKRYRTKLSSQSPNVESENDSGKRQSFPKKGHVKKRNGHIGKRHSYEFSSINDQSTFDMFASCLPGLEPYLNNELLSLAISPHPTPGGVYFKATSVDQILQCHLHLGTASHLFLRTGPPFRALGMEELCLKVSRLKFWKQYIKMDGGFETGALPNLDIRVTSSKSRLFHTKGIAERVERGIWNSLGLNGQDIMDKKLANTTISAVKKQHVNNATIKLLVRIHRNEVEISVDTSSTPLHRRGYRLEGGKAPLREDLAFALLYSSQYQGGGLLDPFCGSGTIVIEGAAMAFGLPPGRLRQAPMLGSRLGSENKWKSLISTSIDNANENIERQRGDPTAQLIVGTDRNKGAIAAALGNAKRAGVLDLVKLEHQAISAVDWFENPTNAPSRILVATNPPFGRRVSSKNKGTEKPLLPLYQTLGHKVGNLQGTVDFSILAQDTNLARKTAIRNLSLNFASKHGGLNVFILGAKDIALRNDK